MRRERRGHGHAMAFGTIGPRWPRWPRSMASLAGPVRPFRVRPLGALGVHRGVHTAQLHRAEASRGHSAGAGGVGTGGQLFGSPAERQTPTLTLLALEPGWSWRMHVDGRPGGWLERAGGRPAVTACIGTALPAVVVSSGLAYPAGALQSATPRYSRPEGRSVSVGRCSAGRGCLAGTVRGALRNLTIRNSKGLPLEY